MKFAPVFFIAILSANRFCRADTIEQIEAKKRGVAVEVIQLEESKERIAYLEKQNADLTAKIAALTKQLGEAKMPTTAPANDTAIKPLVLRYASYRDNAYDQKVNEIKGQIKASSSWLAGYKGNVEGEDPTIKERASIAMWNKQLKELTNINHRKFVPSIFANVQVGDGGVLLFPVKIIQRIDDTTALVAIGNDTTVQIHGISFKDSADDTSVTIATPLLATKTITYGTTIGGTRTVILLEPFDPKDYEKY